MILYSTWDGLEPQLRAACAGLRVIDLGAGGFTTARLLKGHAQSVTLVDRDWPHAVREVLAGTRHPTGPLTPMQHARVVDARFSEILVEPGSYDVAILAWPLNRYLPGLIEILVNIPSVVYLGCNWNGSACGDGVLFKHLITRPVGVEAANAANALTVYGAPLPPEEWRTDEALWTGDEWAILAQGGIVSREGLLFQSEQARAARRRLTSVKECATLVARS